MLNKDNAKRVDMLQNKNQTPPLSLIILETKVISV